MSQPITPELRRWIAEQARAGHDADTVLQAMRESGWETEVAVQALENVLRSHLHELTQAETMQGSPSAAAMPEPDLTGSPLNLDGGDRRVAVLGTLRTPRIVLLGGLLSDAECEALVEAARPRMNRSLTVATRTGGQEVSTDRTSRGMFFQRGESELVARIEARIARLVNWPVTHGEGLQVLHYQPGAEYKPHYDYFDPDAPGTPTLLRRGGQRVATVVIYLNEPEQGGGTIFPDISLEVAPRRGNAVFFSYARPHPDTRTLHGGAPVLAGEKWIATKWLREREFR
jgi:prolyl 4-hydroxylase